MTTERIVDVRLAFAFDCASCGHENFVRALMHEFSREEQIEMHEALGEKPETGSWLTHPETVSCEKCGESFRAINPGQLVNEEG